MATHPPVQAPHAFTDEEKLLLATSTQQLEEQSSQMSFDIDKLVSRLKGEKWQQVLQAHLYFDHVVSALLADELKNPNAIDTKRMSFSQKLQLIHALGLIPEDFVPVVSIVNRIRNRLAHDLEANIGDDEIAQIKSSLPRWFKRHAMTDSELDDPEALRNIMVFVLTYLESARHRNALRRLKQRKAFLNAVRVLEDSDAHFEP